MKKQKYIYQAYNEHNVHYTCGFPAIDDDEAIETALQLCHEKDHILTGVYPFDKETKYYMTKYSICDKKFNHFDVYETPEDFTNNWEFRHARLLQFTEGVYAIRGLGVEGLRLVRRTTAEGRKVWFVTQVSWYAKK